MRVLVCGGRDFDDWDTLDGVLSYDLQPDDTLIHGDARGADRLAALWFRSVARDPDRQIEQYPAEWGKYGNAAGHIRNKRMLEEGKPDKVVAFNTGGPGTANMVKLAKEAGVKVIEVGNVLHNSND